MTAEVVPLFFCSAGRSGAREKDSRWEGVTAFLLFCGTSRNKFFTLRGMCKSKVRFRQPSADEQIVLSEMTVKLLERPQDIRKCDQVLVERHYLKNAKLVGEQLR